MLDFYDDTSFNNLKVMPLTHYAKKDRDTGINNGEQIILNGYFDTKTDNDLSSITGNNENLCFFFYAKPAYKDSHGYDPSDPPIIFIITPDITPKRVLPFDSGSYIKNRYDNILGNNYLNDYNLLNFQMITDITILGKYINSLWKHNYSYYIDKPKINKKVLKNEDSYVKALIRIINAPITDYCDERKHSIEVQYNSRISLKGNLKAVLLSHNAFENNTQICDIIKSLNVITLLYKNENAFLANSISEFFYKEIEHYYRVNNYFR